MRLDGKIAVITGGSKGLGRSIATRFVQEGARVISVDLTKPDIADVLIEDYQLSVTDREGCKVFFDYVKETYGKIDILVNNAGITKDALLNKMTDEMWDMVLNVNLTGVYNLTKYIGVDMMMEGEGSIINIASVVGEYGNIGQSNYAAAKSALYGLTKTWAKEFARKGANVRVNSISPGYIMTDILKTIPDELLQSFAEMTMLKRLGQPEEIANVALFLASSESSYVTGHNLSANGGMRL